MSIVSKLIEAIVALLGSKQPETEERKPLLDLIGKVEASGNYNAYYGDARNTDVNLTDMTVSGVLAWQDQFVRNGSRSSAVGKYQIIRKTLRSLVKSMGLSGNEVFNEEMQDAMAVELLNRRGYSKFLSGQKSRFAFANNLAKEWASFPVHGGLKHGMSYYAGDGLNKALVSPEKVNEVLMEVYNAQ